jgi:hypothetical protein
VDPLGWPPAVVAGTHTAASGMSSLRWRIETDLVQPGGVDGSDH